MKLIRQIGFVIFICWSTAFFAQNENPSYSNPDLIKHQVGIGISKFINSAFSSDKNAYNIEYRYKNSQKVYLRAGMNYERDDSDSGFINTGIKIGIDKNLRRYQYWTIYYGIDLMGDYSNYKNIDKDIYKLGLAPFLGIQFNISKNFSLSIEPNIYLKYTIAVDHSIFQSNNTTRCQSQDWEN